MPLEDIRRVREEKLKKLRDAGINPYPAESSRTHSIHDALSGFEKLEADKRVIAVAGRVMALREHGGSTFVDVYDGSATMQVYFKKDVLGEKDYRLFIETTDIGDIIEASGSLFLTKKNERTLQANRYRMLSKTLLPLPEKWHGLQDVEERFRKRYLDLIFNPEAKVKFEMRARIIREIRDFMDRRGFIEVTTPTLQPLYGGASARPFKTHLNAFDMDMYLRIAPELYLKRLLVGGFQAVYEFTTNFRNEGMDRDHNPEFSVMEFYIAYKDHQWAMEYTEELFHHVIEKVKGSTNVQYQDQKIHFSRPYVRATFSELFSQYVGSAYENMDEAQLRAKAKEMGILIEKHLISRSGIADDIFKKAIRQKLVEPTFVTGWPAELLPLAKRSENPEYVEAFQFYAGGMELIKAFTELNDPADQKARFAAQESRRAKGDEEAQRMDEDYIQALEYGLPPAAGWGLGIDRFVALLTDSHSIREVILFPLMRQKD